MDAYVNERLIDRLETQGDDELRALIARARDILAAREDKRKKEAIAAIRQLAAEHGLGVTVKKPARRRGRPPKSKSS